MTLRARVFAPALVVLVVAGGACLDLSIPRESVFLCGEGGACPAEFVCRAGLCRHRSLVVDECATDADCDDGLACTTEARCVEGSCEGGEPVCGTLPFSCAVRGCLEPDVAGGEPSCTLAVHHDACGDGEYCNTNVGCVPGEPCLEDADCDDELFCDGAERCLDYRCVYGLERPSLDDDEPCTLDACAEETAAVVHVAVPDGNTCPLAPAGEGVCAAGRCDVSRCGDGVVDFAAGESCDDGDDGNDDESGLCTTRCAPPACGDSLVYAPAEQCDDGNTASGDGCRADCGKLEVCGDGVLDEGEACDDGNDNPNDGCDLGCSAVRWSERLVLGLGPSGGAPLATGLSFPQALAVDRAGSIVVADTDAHRVLLLDAASGRLQVVAGTGTAGVIGDGGPATSAALYNPRAVAIDGAGNIFIAEIAGVTGPDRVRRVDARTGAIAVIAGAGTPGSAGDGGAATLAQLRDPSGLAVDGQGNLYIADSGNHRVRRVAAASGIITTVAGSGTRGFGGDDLAATSALLDAPLGVAVDGDGDLYIADSGNHRVRRVSALTGVIVTVAGDGTVGAGGDDGPATSAQLNTPAAVAVDAAGKLYIADALNHRVRVVDGSGDITTFAGGGASLGDAGPATSARLVSPTGVSVTVDGAVLIASAGQRRVRRVSPGGSIATVIGSGASTTAADGSPATSARLVLPSGVALSGAGELLVADAGDHRVRRVSLAGEIVFAFAGTGEAGFDGDGAPSGAARLNRPARLALDAAGAVYLSDTQNHRLRRVDGATGDIETIAGTGVAGSLGDGGLAGAAELSLPDGIAVDGDGNILFADSGNHVVRRIDAVSRVITTIAGDGTPGFDGDGDLATLARLTSPADVAVDDDGDLLIADTGNHAVRHVDGITGEITTLAGLGAPGFSGDGGQAALAGLSMPAGVAFGPGGDIWIADSGAHRVRRIDATTGEIETMAGTGATSLAGDGGSALLAHLEAPWDLVVTSDGGAYFTERDGGRVRHVDGATGTIVTVVGRVDGDDGPFSSAALGRPAALASLTPELTLVADGAGGRVRVVDDAAGWLSTATGYPGGAGEGSARFGRVLLDAAGIAPLDDGRVLVSERNGHRLRALLVPDAAAFSSWTVADLTALPAGHDDGALDEARFDAPAGLAWDPLARIVYIADSGNHVVRAFDVASDDVVTVAGTPRTFGFAGDGGPADLALLYRPEAVAVGSNGTRPGGALYIADRGNHRVRRVDLDAGVIDTVLGDGTPASSGVGEPARFFPVDAPAGLTVDRYGNLYVTSRRALRQVWAGDDGIATGDDVVSTLWGGPPREFPASGTFCLTGVALAPPTPDDSVLRLVDGCRGFLIELTVSTGAD